MTHHQPRTSSSRRNHTQTLLLSILGCAGAAKAQQQVLTPSPAYNITPPAVQAMQDQGAGSLETAPLLPSVADLLQWGPVFVHPHLDYQLSYVTGIQSTPGQPQNSIVQTISPGVLFNLGTHWSLDYTPTLTYYSNSKLQDSTGQNVSLVGGTSYEDWVFGLSQSASLISAPLIQTGEQTDSQSYGTGLTASYRFNSSMSLDMSVNQNFYYVRQAANVQSFEALQNSKEWSTMEYLNYQLWSRLTFGIGAGFTYDDETGSPDMTSEQLEARVNWRVANKLTLTIHAGAEDRQFLSGGQGSSITPIFGAAISYKPFKHTLLTLSADRGVAPSLLLSQITTSTSLSVSLQQRLLEKLSLDVSGSYSATDYAASVSTLAVDRTDDVYTFNARLSWAFWKRATASVFYTYSEDSSSDGLFSFTSDQVGVELGYRF